MSMFIDPEQFRKVREHLRDICNYTKPMPKAVVHMAVIFLALGFMCLSLTMLSEPAGALASFVVGTGFLAVAAILL
jgi:hypothetical protein